MTGSEHNDEFYMDKNGRIRTKTNRSGGIQVLGYNFQRWVCLRFFRFVCYSQFNVHFQGGISNGEIINMRIGFKPTSTISVSALSSLSMIC